jgi:hypothetical protein
MKRNTLFLVASLGLGVVALANPAFAQTTTTGAVKGRVTDKATGSGLGDVTVVATSPVLQGSASELTDSSGEYQLTNLPPGLYEVVFYYGEIKIRQPNVTVQTGSVTPVYVKIDTAAGQQDIVVDQKAPSIDVGSAKQGVKITPEYTKNVPVRGRTYEGVLGSAGGAQGDRFGISFSGSTSVENNYVIDGINTTGLTYGTVGSPLINDFIQEIEVITGGYNAEFGRSTGGVVNVVTKSGGNEFHGTVFANLTPFQAKGDRVFVAGTAISAETSLDYQLDFGFDLGGPIIKDKVWFYVAFAPQVASTTVTRIVGARVDRRNNTFDYSGGDDPDGDELTTKNPGCELSQTCEADGVADVDENGLTIFEEIERKNLTTDLTAYTFVAKVNFAASPQHQGQVSLIGSPTSTHFVGVAGTPTATQVDNKNTTIDVSAKWNSKLANNKTEVDVVLGWHHGTDVDDPIKENATYAGMERRVRDIPMTRALFADLGSVGRNADAPESNDVLQFCTDDDNVIADAFPSIQNCPINGYLFNSPGFLSDTTEDRYSAKVTVTQRIKAAGHHQIKAGLDLENNNLKDFSSLTGGKRYDGFVAFDELDVFQYAKIGSGTDTCGIDANGDGTPGDLLMCDYLEEFKRTTSTFNWAGFVQDAWQILPNLTLNAGIRYEEQHLRSAEQIRDYIDPITGEAVGKDALTLNQLWAPRIGLLYDWTKEGRSKVYGNFGRFYESIPMDINNRAFGGETVVEPAWGWANQCGAPYADLGDSNTPRLPGDPESCPTQISMTDFPDNGVNTFSGSNPLVGTPPGIALIQPGLRAQYLDEIVVGVEYEVVEDLRVGASFQNRRLGRVIEDLSVDGATTYIISNPGEDVDTSDLEQQAAALPMTDPRRPQILERVKQFKQIKNFDKPQRNYNALQLTAVKRYSKNFFVQGSYTYSRLEGNYPGLFSDNNGQLDPNITSQYDLIELLSNRNGRLPADRPHNLKLDGYYTFDLKDAGAVTTGVSLRAQSGSPIDSLGRHALYGPNEAFVLPRGTFGRTDFITSADLRLQYSRPVGKNLKVSFFFDLYNVFNAQTETRVDQEYTQDRVNPIVGGGKEDLPYLKRQGGGGVETPNLARKKLNYGNTSARLAPITTRFGIRLEF